MPYFLDSGILEDMPLNFKTPSVNTKIKTKNGNYSVLYAFNHVENARFIITRIMKSKFFVITCYAFQGAVSYTRKPADSKDPVFICHPYFIIQLYETCHCLEMHIREKPSDAHIHIGLPFIFSYHLEYIAPLLNYYFSPLTNDPQKSTENFIKAIHFFQRNPMIPGIFFSDNEYAQTNGYNENGIYPHGPYELWNHCRHAGSNHSPPPTTYDQSEELEAPDRCCRIL
ncbi:hypothetical protein [Candidatus Sororendozoicomonas aggregata]|uniref:hypothetical protein n=1 Tax=Candidatus Sororendozoicomonas aggregata TaxID=3073239 RepID=UPI002ED09E2F